MPYSYTLAVVIPASAREIYDAWLDSVAHSEMTGGRAEMSAELGAEFSAWDGYIAGRNLELVPGERIVQSWRTTKFLEDHEDSLLTVTFDEREDGTLLTLLHSNVPPGHVGYEEGGWQKYYFEPMIAYFSGKRSRGGKAEEEQRPAAERLSQRTARQAARRARLKRPAATKKAAVPKTRAKRPAAKKTAAARKAGPRRLAARRKSAAKKKAAAPRTQRKGQAPKAKKAAATRRAKATVRAKARPKRAASAGRRSAGRRWGE